MRSSRLYFSLGVALLFSQIALADDEKAINVLRAGAYAVDVTPEELPVLVNGGMYSRKADKVVDRLYARCLVLDDGTNQIAIAVVDSCMMPRSLLDTAKELASKTTGIPAHRMLIAATHTHSAPAVMGCLGTDRDEKYARFLPARIARGIQLAHQNLEPAQIGWAKSRDPRNVFNRRWLMKEGTARTNPFSGKQNDRAQMNPGFNNSNKIKQTGTVDDEVSVVSVRSKDGRNIALLANYSTHYAGSPALSSDYFGAFAEQIALKVIPPLGKGGQGGVKPEREPKTQEPPLAPPLKGGEKMPAFVGIMSNGTSGDTNCIDFTRSAARKFNYHSVAKDTAQAAFKAYAKIEYFNWAPIVMEEDVLKLKVRMPTDKEVAKAKEFLATAEGKKLRSIPAVYARETVLLSQMPPTRELKLQAIRIGDLGIAAIPNEVYTITGLSIKKESPLPATFTIELANGAEGYIPPPEQHKLGGYTTWRARTSCLEETAEPQIRAKVLELLRKVAAQRKNERAVNVASGERKLSESSSRPARTVNQNEESNQGADVPRSPVRSPVSPEDSLKHLHVRPGMKVELVAAEPLVRDPVAFDWGPDGRLWVVEYLDYPTGIDGKGMGGGRVVYLEDTNDDGRYNKSTVFVDGLNFPTGVMAWRGGTLITAAPDILFAEDTNRDGKADKVTKLYTGFHEANQQLRVNGLRWGLDNWIYCASGSHHGGYGKESKIKSTKTGELVHIGARDFRIKPDEGLIDPQSGPSQFGRNRDAWGNWYGSQNAKPMFHFVVEDRYLRRNPHVAYPNTTMLISDVPGQRPVFPRSKPGKFHHASQAGRFTSANSAMIYGDELLGQEFAGNSFVSEPVHNLVHREIVERNGATFKSHKPKDEEETEFLASEDTWFRPTTIRTGPDGALWVADMYREIIEHPRWVSDELKPVVDTRSGTNRGRIYRIYAANKKPREVPRLDKLGATELVSLLESPNATLRDMAQIQIVTRELEEAVAPLEALVLRSQRPETRLQAMCTLDGLKQLEPELLLQAIADEDIWIRRQCLRLWEDKLDSSADCYTKFLNFDDPDIAVRLQYACSLGEWDCAWTGKSLARLLRNERGSALVTAAALSSLNERNLATATETFFRGETNSHPPTQAAQGLLVTALGYGKRDVVRQAIREIVAGADEEFAPWQLEMLAVVHHQLAARKEAVAGLLSAEVDAETLMRVKAASTFARGVLDRDKGTPQLQISAMRLVVAGRPGEADLQRLARFLNPQMPLEVQSAAADALSQTGHQRVPSMLMAGWKSHSPQLRSQVLDALLARGPWLNTLLASIEKGEVAAADVDAVRRQRLLTSRNKTVREQAKKVFAGGVDADRAKVIVAYTPVLESLASADLARGKEVFAKRCSACHRLQDVGIEVGPNLTGLTDKSPGSLLTSILDPNRSVEPKYVSYTAVTRDGRLLVGMLADESGGSLTLLDAEGKRHALPRGDLDELSASGKSLMPEGLEKDISVEQMRNLLGYLRHELHTE